MNVIVTDSPEQAFRRAAGMIADEIRRSPAPVLGLATGRTMENIYRLLVQRHAADALDFSGTTSFNLDEYAGLEPTDPNSYHHYMQEHLFAHVNMPAERAHVPDGVAPDLEAECARYEAAIRAANGIDLQLLGIGETGHIGFNEPPSAFDSRTRVVHLDEVTRRQNSGMFGNDPERVPERALTMGVGTILDARCLVLVAVGDGKAAIVDEALNGPVSEAVSASAIRLHDNATIILDRAAARIWAQNRD
ncbi:glucosamine-6-phosphate deaminase [Gluconobacter cerinus]|uniref:glucosamine-6-phosphate deaminase n=1 Tax=Gluconobacter TaxID=441 RepID=UPI001B8BDAC0|nr:MULTISPECIES: glucosamine-6-phosphate deaminase [Gluconobacter]MBS1035911.1 glucosamine-6-phosphate deaminase [Gluconobacter cerinus]MBS1042244.1 glucosamine-6-phosphate deaminase [Gluconobacter cerinus]MBS1048821.1 glucosamine-6-phosphate deaminase [Gluconobacter cerinus]MBS1073257.1 glucosamine-6-phosphate deaminase [Gluconobacter cerinus]